MFNFLCSPMLIFEFYAKCSVAIKASFIPVNPPLTTHMHVHVGYV